MRRPLDRRKCRKSTKKPASDAVDRVKNGFEYTRRDWRSVDETQTNNANQGIVGTTVGTSVLILNDLQEETLELMLAMDTATQTDLLAIARGLAKRPPQ
tara:strand:+ start:27276 stop:27572 length:297 start_codon:yes stop_codon:yes gene_type:complete